MNPGLYSFPPGGQRATRRVVGLLRGTPVLINPSNLSPLGPAIYTSSNPSPGSLTTMLTITGRGAVWAAALGHVSASNQSIRARMTVDGTVLFDATSASASPSTPGYMLVGALSGSQVMPQYLPFERELKIEFSSNIATGAGAVSLQLLGEIYA